MAKQVCPECNGRIWDQIDVWEIPCPVCGGEKEIAVPNTALLARMAEFVRDVLRDHAASDMCPGDAVCERCLEAVAILRLVDADEETTP